MKRKSWVLVHLKMKDIITRPRAFPLEMEDWFTKKKTLVKKQSSEVSVGKGSKTQPIRWATEEVGLSNGRKKNQTNIYID